MRRRDNKSVVKSYSLTIQLPLILLFLSPVEVGGMYNVAVKCLDILQNANCEGSSLTGTDAEARKRGERTGLDTLVVHAVNDDHSLLAIHRQRLSKSIK